MKEKKRPVDKLYVVDFDRCIGNTDAHFDLMGEVLSELGIGDAGLMARARMEAESRGESFSVLEYIQASFGAAKLEDIERTYHNKAVSIRSDLLEPGARRFLDYLREAGKAFCIMSYGETRWQQLKIVASGLGDYIPVLIVPTKQKSRLLSEWFDENDGRFMVPSGLADIIGSTMISEIVLIDDKTDAFQSMPPKTRGYLVRGKSAGFESRMGSLTKTVTSVERIDRIIDIEANR